MAAPLCNVLFSAVAWPDDIADFGGPSLFGRVGHHGGALVFCSAAEGREEVGAGHGISEGDDGAAGVGS